MNMSNDFIFLGLFLAVVVALAVVAIFRSAKRSDRAIPGSDLPGDLAARPGGSAPVTPTRPHTLDEIQRHEPKALSSALSNTRNSFFGRLKGIFTQGEMLTAGEMESLEEILYTSDLGPQTVQRLMGAVEERVRSAGGSGFESVREALRAEMMSIFDGISEGRSNGNGHDAVPVGHTNGKAESGNGTAGAHGNGKVQELFAHDREVIEHAGHEYIEGLEHLNIWNHKPAVMMIVGVNGAGKTTTIGKLARRIAQSGRKVMVAAGDTFRAAAGDQLKVWTERAAVEIFAPANVSDPSAVAFEAVQAAKTKEFDVVIIDTAGRLHTAKHLMEELKKMQRVVKKLSPEAPHEILLVLDANSGQNALQQAREFHSALQVTGVVLTKLDGTAKGGVAVGVACELGLPIKLIGVGESIEDLRHFNSKEFVDSIL
jgi:fused signal recognition particle receptor